MYSKNEKEIIAGLTFEQKLGAISSSTFNMELMQNLKKIGVSIDVFSLGSFCFYEEFNIEPLKTKLLRTWNKEIYHNIAVLEYVQLTKHNKNSLIIKDDYWALANNIVLNSFLTTLFKLDVVPIIEISFNDQLSKISEELLIDSFKHIQRVIQNNKISILYIKASKCSNDFFTMIRTYLYSIINYQGIIICEAFDYDTYINSLLSGNELSLFNQDKELNKKDDVEIQGALIEKVFNDEATKDLVNNTFNKYMTFLNSLFLSNQSKEPVYLTENDILSLDELRMQINEESVVLLKNKDNLLPLTFEKKEDEDKYYLLDFTSCAYFETNDLHYKEIDIKKLYDTHDIEKIEEKSIVICIFDESITEEQNKQINDLKSRNIHIIGIFDLTVSIENISLSLFDSVYSASYKDLDLFDYLNKIKEKLGRIESYENKEDNSLSGKGLCFSNIEVLNYVVNATKITFDVKSLEDTDYIFKLYLEYKNEDGKKYELVDFTKQHLDKNHKQNITFELSNLLIDINYIQGIKEKNVKFYISIGIEDNCIKKYEISLTKFDMFVKSNKEIIKKTLEDVNDKNKGDSIISHKVKMIILIFLEVYLDLAFALAFYYSIKGLDEIIYVIILGVIFLGINFLLLFSIIKGYKDSKNKCIVRSSGKYQMIDRIYSLENIASSDISSNIIRDKGLVSQIEKKTNKVIVEREIVDLEKICKDFISYAKARGYLYTEITVRSFLSSLSGCSLIFLNNKNASISVEFIKLFTEFIGSDIYIEKVLGSWLTPNSLYQKSTSEGLVATNFINGLRNIQKDYFNFVVLDNCRPESMNKYFQNVADVLDLNNFRKILYVDENNVYEIPTNFYIIAIINSEDVGKIPYNLTPFASVCEVQGSIVDKEINTVEKICLTIKQFRDTLFINGANVDIGEDNWKKCDRIFDVINKYNSFSLTNKEVIKIENFFDAYLVSKGEKNLALDCALAYLILPIIFSNPKYKYEDEEGLISPIVTILGDDNSLNVQKMIERYSVK